MSYHDAMGEGTGGGRRFAGNLLPSEGQQVVLHSAAKSRYPIAEVPQIKPNHHTNSILEQSGSVAALRASGNEDRSEFLQCDWPNQLDHLPAPLVCRAKETEARRPKQSKNTKIRNHIKGYLAVRNVQCCDGGQRLSQHAALPACKGMIFIDLKRGGEHFRGARSLNNT